MTDWEYDLVLGLLAAGVLVILTSLVGAVVVRDTYDRLHFLTPVTSLGGPLIGIALAITNGPTLTTAEILVVVLLLAATGPVLGAATGRVNAQREGEAPKESPE